MGRAFDRVLLARHFALSAGAGAAYFFRTELAVGYMVLWIVGISATLNFLAYAFSARPSLSRFCMEASPLIGIGGWGSLVFVTNGLTSPFVAGLWLEIVFSAMSLQLGRVLWVTGGTIFALWFQQSFLGLEGHLVAMTLQSGFMAGMGLATFLVTWRWMKRQASVVRESERLGERLDLLTRELEDERTVAAVGENVARLAHGLKNTVHSLRGFVGLIEPRLEREGADSDALEGLRAAIDDLERLARLTLSPGDPGASVAASVATPSSSQKSGGMDSLDAVPLHADVPEAVRRALSELATSHPGVSWETRTDGHLPQLTIPESSFSETLVILLRNAVEAMEGEGTGIVETRVEKGKLHLRIGDNGPGLQDVDLAEIFTPGYTTKKQGSGYGLFLARRIIEEHGGGIEAESRPGGGAQFEIVLPVVDESHSQAAR